MKTCGMDGCDRRYYGKGLCRVHWARLRRHGDPLVTARPSQDVLAPPHHSPAECDRWAAGRGKANGCPHFTDAHVAALKACGQWPTTATWPFPEHGFLLVYG